MNRLLDDTDFGDDFEGVRDRLILETFYLTGMRLSELIGLMDLKLLFFAVHTFFLLSYFFTDYPYHGIIWMRHK